MRTPEAIIRTVCGDIAPEQLGRCYGHGHLLGRPPSNLLKSDLVLDERQMALDELKHFKACGGQAVVEMLSRLIDK